MSTGTFTALAHNPNGIHCRWSADGRQIGYSTVTCQLGEADPDGGNAHLAPVFGSQDEAKSPDFSAAATRFASRRTAPRWWSTCALAARRTATSAGDVHANTIVDTATGAVGPLPVPGQVSALLFQPDGMLVRSGPSGHGKLTLLKADRSVGSQVPQPASVATFQLLGYAPA